MKLSAKLRRIADELEKTNLCAVCHKPIVGPSKKVDTKFWFDRATGKDIEVHGDVCEKCWNS